MPRKPRQRALPQGWVIELSECIFDPLEPEKPPKVIGEFEVPAWWECEWRREPCKKQTCNFCGRLRKFGLGCTESEKDEEYSTQDFEDSVAVLRHQARDWGISDEDLLGGQEVTEDDFDENGNYIEDPDEEEAWLKNQPPHPDMFLICRRLRRWASPISRYAHSDEHKNDMWIKTEVAKDLLWYSPLLERKVYRQMNSRWRIARGDELEKEVGAVDLHYTSYVLRESCRIIETSLIELSKPEMHPPFAEVLANFRRLKPSILAFASRK